MAEIQLNAVSFRYPGAEQDTLSELDLTVENGATHALLGASGAGKTTMLNLLTGLLAPTAGQIRFDGHDVSSLGARDRNVALVFQFPVLYESKSVLDNLMFPLLNRGWERPEAQERAIEIATELEIDDVLHTRPATLSLFQKQLTAIAKSLVRTDVDLVLLDEPLTAVEPARKWHLRQMLLKFQAAHGLTMIYVTHDQTEALTFASRVSLLADGRILQTATPEDIYNQPVSRYVGDFIGSPGMRFIEHKHLVSAQALRDLQLPDADDATGKARDGEAIGLRAEWLQAQSAIDGHWHVEDVSLEGTSEGVARSALTVCQSGVELVAHGLGDWKRGDRATLHAKRYARVRDEAAGRAG